MFVFVVSPVIEVRGRGCLQQRLQHSRCSGSYLNKGNGQVKYLSKSGQYYRYHWSSRDNDFGRTIDGRTAEFGAHGCFRSVSLGNASPTVLLEEASCDKASLTSSVSVGVSTTVPSSASSVSHKLLSSFSITSVISGWSSSSAPGLCKLKQSTEKSINWFIVKKKSFIYCKNKRAVASCKNNPLLTSIIIRIKLSLCGMVK